MASRFRSRAVALLSCSLAVAVCGACSDAVRLMQATESGGVVTYLFKEDRGGPMGSPYRREALKMIEQKCPAGYTIVRDGEVKGATLSSREGEEGDVTGRRWGIQFRCK